MRPSVRLTLLLFLLGCLGCASGTDVGRDAASDANLDARDGGCETDEDCDDGYFCTGAEQCVEGACKPSAVPCRPELCDELDERCLEPCGGPDSPECEEGRSCCGLAGCRNLRADPNHCGACGTSCGTTTDRCVDGRCRCGDGPPCGPNMRCEAGRCVCVAPWLDCNRDPTDGCEVDSRVDGEHCGACERRCEPAGMRCREGTCVADTCPPGMDDCDGRPETGCETSLETPANCGGCGLACVLANATARCVSGECRIAECRSGFGDCNGHDADGCETDLRIALHHCGGCGRPCGAHAACVEGRCACLTPWLDCDGDPLTGCEVDPRVNRDHCGVCGRRCPAGTPPMRCEGGTCIADTCPPGTGECDGRSETVCETSLTTLSNCGGCGVRCMRANATASCESEMCTIASCAPGFGNCNGLDIDGCETDLLASRDHCGRCGGACGANAVCLDGRCVCVAPWLDCDATAGCETRGDTLHHCRMCGRRCDDANPCTVDGCSASGCTYLASGGSCDDGNACTVGDACVGDTCRGGATRSCDDGNPCTDDSCHPATGCVHTPRSNGSSCDDGNPCTIGETCTAGVCGGGRVVTCERGMSCFGGTCRCGGPSGPVCSGGTWCCSGACVDRSSDEAHCGMCGRACATGLTCCRGTCVDTRSHLSHCGTCDRVCAAHETCCSGNCVDVSTDPHHCGRCGQRCTRVPSTCCSGICYEGYGCP
ncbi:MAG: hypothetical protein NZ898_06925 [Myxococcota bacterium]|nr:hypothetical protein [Myxococcota bacterium]MDW8361875.1 hypothetical protein [Myxococcales bacterium]